MAKRQSRSINEENEIDMTPMLDVVFIMLIFFIVTTSFVREAGIQVIKPEATSQTLRPKGNLFIAVTGDDRIFIDRAEVKIQELKLRIEQIKKELAKGEVIIQVDQASKADMLMKVLDVVREANVPNVSVATRRGG